MSGVVGGGFALRKAGKEVAGGGGKCGKGRESVSLAPQLCREPITSRTECAAFDNMVTEMLSRRNRVLA